MLKKLLLSSALALTMVQPSHAESTLEMKKSLCEYRATVLKTAMTFRQRGLTRDTSQGMILSVIIKMDDATPSNKAALLDAATIINNGVYEMKEGSAKQDPELGYAVFYTQCMK